MMKKFALAIVVSSIALAMVGCGKAEEPAAPAGGAAAPAPAAKGATAGTSPTATLGPGAAGADQRAGSKAGGN